MAKGEDNMKITKVLSLSLLAVLLLVAVLPLSVVLAEETVYGFDETSVLTDLQDSTICGKEFNIDDYVIDEDGTPELLAFTEFAFSTIHEYQQYYALYLYVYYPQGNLDDYEQNTVEMAVTYDSAGEPTAWHVFHIKLLSTDGNKVLYKFRIVDTEGQTIGSIFNRVGQTPSERRYDINSIELRPQGQLTANDYGIGGTWIYTGYSKGMHQSSLEESTLQSTVTQRDTLRLDVHSTYYRTWKNTINSHADQLSSVYFSVPKKIDDFYDLLYAIDFNAYKYLSSPIFCIKSNDTYNKLNTQVGLTWTEIKSDLDSYSSLHWCNIGDAYYYYYDSDPPYYAKGSLDQLSWVFPVEKENDYIVTRDELLTYMDNFSEKFGRDVRSKYSSLLFSDHYYDLSLEEKKITGENIGRKITADETFSLTGKHDKYSIWECFSSAFSKPDVEEQSFAPIEKVSWSDIVKLSDEDICSTYFVADEDVAEFKAYVKQQNSVNKNVYLFRFDVEDYSVWDACTSFMGNNSIKKGYVAQEPIYLDFDIISLTYEKDNVYTVIPVVSDPIDVIAGIEPGGVDIDLDLDSMFGNLLTTVLTALFGIVAVVVFVAIVFGLLKYIFNGGKKR